MNHPVITGLILAWCALKVIVTLAQVDEERPKITLGTALAHLVFMAIFATGVLYISGAF
jgi:hypothetical protein